MRNVIYVLQMEALVHAMMADDVGLSVKTVKSFLSRIPNVFTGLDLIQWLQPRVSSGLGAANDLGEGVS